MSKSNTTTLISALRILAKDIQSDDGVANAAIYEAADRLEEFHEALLDISSNDCNHAFPSRAMVDHCIHCKIRVFLSQSNDD